MSDLLEGVLLAIRGWVGWPIEHSEQALFRSNGEQPRRPASHVAGKRLHKSLRRLLLGGDPDRDLQDGVFARQRFFLRLLLQSGHFVPQRIRRLE